MMKICYRAETKTDQKHGRIILKLRNLEMKQNIYSKKKLIRGTGVVIKEDLTNSKVFIFSKIFAKVSLKNNWSKTGKIYIFKIV